jgi:S-adenosyl methyltransferase
MDRKDTMEHGFASSEIDTSTPHPARLYDFYLGGKDNYAADRAAARQVLRVAPEVRAIAKENRAFLRRAVRFLVGEAGIRQILDIGTGIPSAGNVHQVAEEIAPGTRVVYVDNDPIVHLHASALLTGSGATRIVLADLREPDVILAHPKVRERIDLREPVALLLVAILHFITDGEDPRGILAAFREALSPGSFLALSHGTRDFHAPDTVGQAAAVYDRATAPLVLRSHAEISGFFDGFSLVDPGLVQVPLWRPEGKPPRPKDLAKVAIYGGVGRLDG